MSKLSADFAVEKRALTQNNSRLHAFPRYNPRKVLTFQKVYPVVGSDHQILIG
jgi:hypothetical protein